MRLGVVGYPPVLLALFLFCGFFIGRSITFFLLFFDFLCAFLKPVRQLGDGLGLVQCFEKPGQG